MFGRSNFFFFHLKAKYPVFHVLDLDFFQLKAKYPVLHVLDLDGRILNVILPKNFKKHQNFHHFLKLSLFSPCMILNLGSDLSVDDIVQLGSADTKIGSQDAVKKLLELREK